MIMEDTQEKITLEQLETIRAKAPLMSEGLLSPFQVGSMRKRERQEWEKNKQIRFKAEEDFKKQNRTEEEIKQEELKEKINNLESKKMQIEAQINIIKYLPQLKRLRDNALKRIYQIHIKDLEDINLKLKKEFLKGGLK